ncbi:MAG: hypothetical protein DCC68_01525 [Planctomycetota bacterium]|nr:MAG: hypothetical protein DCC68_01525 [Planctomycetota bacterium]
MIALPSKRSCHYLGAALGRAVLDDDCIGEDDGRVTRHAIAAPFAGSTAGLPSNVEAAND